MPSPFSNGAQNADKAFSKFANGDVTFCVVSLTMTQTIATVAHGLSAAPDFVLTSTNEHQAIATAGGIGYTSGATLLTITHNNTTATSVINVFAANIS